jgi:hypothetical protein
MFDLFSVVLAQVTRLVNLGRELEIEREAEEEEEEVNEFLCIYVN